MLERAVRATTPTRKRMSLEEKYCPPFLGPLICSCSLRQLTYMKLNTNVKFLINN